MRLIDPNEFMQNIAELDDSRMLSTKTIGLCFKKCKAVKAIPLMWIRNEMEKAMEPNRRDYDLIYAASILQLLEHWEKENG